MSIIQSINQYQTIDQSNIKETHNQTTKHSMIQTIKTPVNLCHWLLYLISAVNRQTLAVGQKFA